MPAPPTLHLDRKAKRLTVVGKRNELKVLDLASFGGAEIFEALPWQEGPERLTKRQIWREPKYHWQRRFFGRHHNHYQPQQPINDDVPENG